MSHRKGRVSHDLRARLADILAKRISDPRLELVTLSAVEPTPDFSLARVFYWAHGDTEEVQQALEKAAPFIRRCLGESLRLRRVPQLEFRPDRSLERAERVDEILREEGRDRSAAADEGD